MGLVGRWEQCDSKRGVHGMEPKLLLVLQKSARNTAINQAEANDHINARTASFECNLKFVPPPAMTLPLDFLQTAGPDTCEPKEQGPPARRRPRKLLDGGASRCVWASSRMCRRLLV